MGSTSPFGIADLLRQYQAAYDRAVELYNLFEDSEAKALLQALEPLGRECTTLVEQSGLGWEKCGSLGRHLTFLAYYLKRNDKDSCAQDIKDIVLYDLPTSLKNLALGVSEYDHLDQRLRDAVLPLLRGGHCDSAVRKTFVLLTDRLRRAFGIEAELDGEDLINLVFGNGGKVPVSLGDRKKQAFRNFISGFYGVYRNRFAHNDVEASPAQAAAILEIVNSIILEIEDVAAASVEAAGQRSRRSRAK